MMFMSPTWNSTINFLHRVSILGETYDYFAIACSFLQLIFTLQLLHNFYMAICKSRNGELGNRMKGMMGMRGIEGENAENSGGNPGNQGGDDGMKLWMMGIRVGMRGIKVRMRGINWNRKNKMKVYKIQFSFLAEMKKKSKIRTVTKC